MKFFVSGISCELYGFLCLRFCRFVGLEYNKELKILSSGL